jgi:hypothetical protein
MMRIFLQYILPLAFPSALYLVWALYHKKKAGEDGRHIDLTKGPWVRLIGAGVVLLAIALVAFNQMDGDEPGGVYQPPVFKDGQVIPGHIIRDE